MVGSSRLNPTSTSTCERLDQVVKTSAERETAAKEREVTAKEIDLNRSRWLNPTVIGLFAAALGLIGQCRGGPC
jgi:hypothetical protein